MIKKLRKGDSVYLQEIRQYRKNGIPTQENVRYIGKQVILDNVKKGDAFFSIDDNKVFFCKKVLASGLDCKVYDRSSGKSDKSMIKLDTIDYFYEGNLKTAMVFLNGLT